MVKAKVSPSRRILVASLTITAVKNVDASGADDVFNTKETSPRSHGRHLPYVGSITTVSLWWTHVSLRSGRISMSRVLDSKPLFLEVTAQAFISLRLVVIGV